MTPPFCDKGERVRNSVRNTHREHERKVDTPWTVMNFRPTCTSKTN